MADTPQFDLFGDLPAHPTHARPGSGSGSLRRSSGSARRRSSVPIIEPESAARLLSEHDDYRVLRRLRPRAVTASRSPMPGERLTVIVDTETTGLDHAHDEIIEIGMVAFAHDRQGSVIEVTGVFSALQEPS